MIPFPLLLPKGKHDPLIYFLTLPRGQAELGNNLVGADGKNSKKCSTFWPEDQRKGPPRAREIHTASLALVTSCKIGHIFQLTPASWEHQVKFL